MYIVNQFGRIVVAALSRARRGDPERGDVLSEALRMFPQGNDFLIDFNL